MENARNLEEVTKFLSEQRHRFVGYRYDAVGRYAAEFRAKGEPLPFMLVVKASNIIPSGTVSVHTDLLKSFKGPIVFAWKWAETKFYVLDPEAVFLGEHWHNEREAQPMENFSIFVMEPWNPLTEDLKTCWESVKKKTEKLRKEHLPL